MAGRTHLDDILQIQQLSEGFANSAQGLRQRAALDAYAQLGPQLANEGNFGELAGLGVAAGDPTLMRELVQGKLAAQKKATSAYDEASLTQLIGDPVAAKTIAQLPVEKQDDAVRAFQSTRSNEVAQKGQQLQAQAEGRRVREEGQKQRGTFAKTFDKVEKDIINEEKQLSKVKAAMAKGTLPADAVVFNFLARNLAGEKGPLSDQDRQQFRARTGASDYEAISNYLSGNSRSPLTASQKKAFKDLIDLASSKFDEYKDLELGNQFGNALTDYPQLFDGNNIDKSITERAKRYGYEYDPNAVSFKKKLQSKGTTESGAAPDKVDSENKSMLVSKINSLPDGSVKQSALRKLAEYGDRPIPAEKVAEFNRRLDALMKGN